MSQEIECALITPAQGLAWLQAWMAEQALAPRRRRYTPLVFGMDAPERAASPSVLEDLRPDLFRYQLCMLPVDASNLAWIRTALASLAAPLPAPLICLCHELRAEAIGDLLVLGADDFILLGGGVEEVRARGAWRVKAFQRASRDKHFQDSEALTTLGEPAHPYSSSHLPSCPTSPLHTRLRWGTASLGGTAGTSGVAGTATAGVAGPAGLAGTAGASRPEGVADVADGAGASGVASAARVTGATGAVGPTAGFGQAAAAIARSYPANVLGGAKHPFGATSANAGRDGAGSAHANEDIPFSRAKKVVVDRFECAYLRQALMRHAGNVAGAARASAKHRRAFWALMRKHGIDAETYRQGRRVRR